MLPIELETILMHGICSLSRLFLKYCPRYLINNEYVGRVICILRSPWDYANPKIYDAMNQEILDLMRTQYKNYSTTKFGLVNYKQWGCRNHRACEK